MSIKTEITLTLTSIAGEGHYPEIFTDSVVQDASETTEEFLARAVIVLDWLRARANHPKGACSDKTCCGGRGHYFNPNTGRYDSDVPVRR